MDQPLCGTLYDTQSITLLLNTNILDANNKNYKYQTSAAGSHAENGIWALLVEAAKIIEIIWAVVVAQLVERSLPIPGVRGSNPVMAIIYI